MAKPYTFDYVLKGQSPKLASFGVHTPEGLTIVQYAEAAGVLAQDIDGFTNGRIEGGSMTIPVDISGLTGNVAAENSDVEEIAALGAETASGRPVVVNIPTPSALVFIDGSNDLDISDPLLAPVISMLENGLVTLGGLMQPTDVEQEDITQVVTARKRTRSSGTRS